MRRTDLQLEPAHSPFSNLERRRMIDDPVQTRSRLLQRPHTRHFRPPQTNSSRTKAMQKSITAFLSVTQQVITFGATTYSMYVLQQDNACARVHAAHSCSRAGLGWAWLGLAWLCRAPDPSKPCTNYTGITVVALYSYEYVPVEPTTESQQPKEIFFLNRLPSQKTKTEPASCKGMERWHGR